MKLAGFIKFSLVYYCLYFLLDLGLLMCVGLN